MQQVTETRDRGAYYHINASPGHSNPASLMAKPPHTRKFDRKVPQKKTRTQIRDRTITSPNLTIFD